MWKGIFGQNFSEEGYTCNICLKSFKRKNHLELHTLVHTGEHAYECKFYDKRMKQSSAYRLVWKCTLSIFTKRKIGHWVSVRYVVKMYRVYRNIMRQIMSVKYFLVTNVLKLSERSMKLRNICKYTPEKNLSFCEKKIRQKAHFEIKEFKCSFCEKHFLTASHKKKHESTHEDRKSHPCNICEKVFWTKLQWRSIYKNCM